MLLEVQVCLRCFKNDGTAINADEYALIGPTGSFAVDGLGEEERSVNLTGCSLKLDSYKGRGASERFFEAIRTEIDRFTSFLASLDEASFKKFLAQGIKADLLISFKIDENTMDFDLVHALQAAASKLGLSTAILVNPG